MPATMRFDTSKLALGAAFGLFLLFAAAWIHLPGPQHDELLHAPVVVPHLRSTALYSLEAAGRHFPVMIMSYIGTLKGWLLCLWFLVVPEGVPGYRAFGIAAGLTALWLAWRFASRYWDRLVALLAVVLLATDPSFVHTIRLDYGPVAMAHLLKMGGLCLVSRWLDTASRKSLAAGFFLFGLGIWDKANFTWFLAGTGLAAVALFPRQALARWRAAPIAALALLAGASPFLAYNLKHHAQTWQERGRLEIRWAKLYEAKGTFNGDFMSALAGEDQMETSPAAHDVTFAPLADWMYRLGRWRQTIILPLVGLALVLLPVSLWRDLRRRPLLFPLLASLVTYACMFLTFDGGASVHHVIMLQPFPMLFLAASLAGVSRVAAVAAVAAAVVVNFSVNARHLAVYTRTGGTSGFTDAVYRLTPYLAQNPAKQVYALDWGFSNPIMFLGRKWNLHVDDIFFALNDGREVDRLAGLMRDPQNVFLLHSPQRTLFPAPAKAFFSLADGGIPMRQVAFFEERSGVMAYQVYRPGPAGLRAEAPEMEVRFTPQRVARGQEYAVEAPELRDTWVDVVYDVDRTSSGMATRWCRLDEQGRARLTAPATHPPGTVRITWIRPSGGQWRPARGSIIVQP